MFIEPKPNKFRVLKKEFIENKTTGPFLFSFYSEKNIFLSKIQFQWNFPIVQINDDALIYI